MSESNSCPVCGERLPDLSPAGAVCPRCSARSDGAGPAGVGGPDETAPLCSDADVPETPIPRPPGTPPSGAGKTPASGDDLGVRGREKVATGFRDALDDDTVGAFKTIPPSGGEQLTSWQEGLLVADRFRIVRFVGQGGMGRVYLAQDETLGRPIALKRVPQEIVFDPDARDDLRQEANRLLDLAHENIVRIHTFYEGPTWPFFAMEYLQGPTLKKLLRTRKQYGRTFTPKEVLTIARQVAQGLSYAHAKGVIHRDLKPGNLMLAAPPGDEITEADVVKITDFGVSRVIADSTLRHTGKRSGTLAYMSPEQFHGEPCTVQSDVYSFACTLYELLTGNPPFSSGDVGYQIVHVSPKPLEGVPKAMGAAILRGLSKDPRRRFASVKEFLDALEGRAPVVRLRAPALGNLRAALGALAGVLLVVAIPWLIYPYLAGREKRAPLPTSRSEGAALSPDEAKALREEKTDFAARLSSELLKQIPAVLGPNHEAAIPAGPGAVSFGFSLPEPTGSSYQRALFEGLLFQYYGQDPKEVKTVRGVEKDGRKTFLLSSLKEGTYTLRAYAELKVGGQTVVEPLLDDRPPVKLSVDVTPPEFRIEFANPDLLVSTDPPLYATFDEMVELRLRPVARPEENFEAWRQVVYETRAGGKFDRLENPRSTVVVLPPGVTTACRFYAKDAAGNQSGIQEIKIRRLNLEVDLFRLASPDGVYGNLARVQGVLKVEGDQRPALRYFVNGEAVRPEPTPGEGEMLLVSPGRSSAEGAVPFAATLRLPNPTTNAIEVRYAWNDNPPKPFARPAQISDVKVRAPSVTLAVKPPTYTNSVRLRIEGRVEPTFDELELYLDCLGKGHTRLQTNRVSPEPPVGLFSEEIALEPDRENSFRIVCFYRKEQLPESPLSFSIFCDTRPPRLADRVRFEPRENRLELSISPAEELQQLRVREVGGGGQEGAWRGADWDLPSFTYRYTTRLPQSPVQFQLELTDLAGNVAVVEEVFSPSGASIAAASKVPAMAGESSSGGSPSPPASPAGREEGPPPAVSARSVARAAGVQWIVSPFLEELGMDFVPFGHERWEMARIEVPERAWSEFLREAKGRRSLRPGAADLPMTLREESPDLVREFVKWFGQRSGDGYVYEIPTAEQWLEAFAGVPAASAPERVRAWFAGGPSGFVASPRARYGQNVVLAIGSRPENRTPTGLLDMEANVQEIVRVGEELKVIGGSNRDSDPRAIESRCLSPRPYDPSAQVFQGAVTGLRLCRRPASTSGEKER